MADKYYKAFTITGVASNTVYDAGVVSSEEEPRTIVGVYLYVTGRAGNIVEFWHETERIGTVYDYSIDTDESAGSTNVQKFGSKINYLPFDRPIPVGERFKAALTCGATNKNLFGCYVYEITGS